MSSNSINSRMAAQRSHSLTWRWPAGRETRRRSGRGGKSGPRPSVHFSLRPPPPLSPGAPRDRLPNLEGVRRQRVIGPEDGTVLPAFERHAEIGPHGGHVTFPPLLQAVQEIRIVPVVGITGNARVAHPTSIGFIPQRQRNLCLGLKGDVRRHVRLLALRPHSC